MTGIKKYVWRGSQNELETLDMLLSEVWFPPADAVTLLKNDPETEDDPGWRAEVYFSDAPEATTLAKFLSENGIVAQGTEEAIPDIDWVAHALEGLGIIRAGRFVLYGIHDESRLPGNPGDVPVRIDANQAFGTGHHPTTAGCLEMLDRLAGTAPENLLDLGTGSAVLAIAARKIWPHAKMLASDIDEKSVEIAAGNAKLNQTDNIGFVTAAGFSHPQIASAAPFDFVFANILAGPLQELAPDMAAYTAPGARVLLAGLLARQEPAVLSAYEQAGFELEARLAHDTWPVLTLSRTNA